MANVYDHDGMDGSLKLDTVTTGNYVLASGSDEVVSTLVLHIVVASGTISITLKARSTQKDARRNGNDEVFLPIPYTKRYVSGAVADDSTVSAAITGTAIIKADVTGLQPSLEITQTNGTGYAYWRVYQGAA